MVTTLDMGTRVARKPYRCGMCGARINPGDHHAFQTCVYDGRVYTFRECLACERDGIVNYVHSWSGDYYDEGVTFEQAVEWAEESVMWPSTSYWSRRAVRQVISGAERLAARNWLARTTRED